jgi:hypothetical protein
MSLRTYPDIIQGTPEWEDVRRGMVTASVVGQLITPSTLKVAANPASRGLTALVVAERITGHTDPTFTSDDMERGWEDEPRARDAYSEHHAPVTEMGFMVREFVEDSFGPAFRIGYSPDGLVGDDGLIEIKSRRPKKHVQTILADQVPAENIAQIQAGLFVSGRKWCDYISYAGGMPLWVKRVEADPAWATAITAAMEAFEKAAFAMRTDYLAAVEGLPMTERTGLDADLVVI